MRKVNPIVVFGPITREKLRYQNVINPPGAFWGIPFYNQQLNVLLCMLSK
jgi:hypothetical protein